MLEIVEDVSVPCPRMAIMSGGRFVATLEDACPLPAQANVDGPGL